MQPVEDIWTCNRCGWTYPNHHPSAKHRRNHKKVCGKLPGFIIDNHHSHGDEGSSDEASSGDENSKHHEVSSAAPTVTLSSAMESQSRSFDVSAALQKSETAAPDATAAVVESAADPVGVSKTSTQEVPKAEPVTGASEPEENPKPVLKSAVLHPEEDLWICRACGWTYPNAHPSAKHRRNHKKQCGKTAAAVPNGNGGSSDDDSDGEHPKAAGITEKASAPAPTVAESQEQTEPEPTPIITSTRAFSLESVSPAAADNDPKEVDASPAAQLEETAAVVEAPVTPAPSPAPAAVSKGSAVAHPDDNIWICKECGWTYPNHHPSAKHRRNHKKQCPGKVAAAAPAPGGSSDDDSDGEQHQQSQVQQAKTEAKEVPTTESVSRDFDLDSLAKPVVTPAVQDKNNPEETAAVLQVVQPPAISEDPKSEKLSAPEKTEKEAATESAPDASAVESAEAKRDEVSAAPAAPKVSNAVPHLEDDIWICKECGWTYPNHHPSAKHRRNHKKNCPGKVAAAAPAPGGSSDEDSDEERHHQVPVGAPKPEVVHLASDAPQNGSVSRDINLNSLKAPSVPEVKVQNGNVLPQVVTVVKVMAPAEDETPTALLALKEVAEEKPPTDDASQVVESKAALDSISASRPSAIAMKGSVKEIIRASPPVVFPDHASEKQSGFKCSGTPKAGSAVPHSDEDVWICKECGWRYPNHHPSAKHRRNHKKNCPGKVAALAPTPGGSSDEDSGDEHHHQPLMQAPRPGAAKATADVSVPRESNVGLLASEPQAAEVKAELRESPYVVRSVIEASTLQAPAESSSRKETTEEQKPVDETVSWKVENSLVCLESHEKETTVVNAPAMLPKDLSKGELKVTKPAASSTAPSSAVAHPEEDPWKCRHCDWTYPNAHPSAKHRRNHKKHCPGESAAASKGGSSDDDSDHETHSSALAEPALLAATGTAEAPAIVSRDFQLPTADVKEPAAEAPASVSRDFQLPTADVKEQAAEAPASASRDCLLPTADVKEQAAEATPPASKLEEPSGTGPAQPPEEVKTLTSPPKEAGSAVPHPQDPNDIWVCKECGWTYPNAHPSAKHRRNHKKQCPGKSVAAGHTAGGSSDDDSDDGSLHRGQTSAAETETAAAAEVPTVTERAMPDLGVQLPNMPAEGEAPKVETRERTTVAQLVYEEQSREQEAKSREETKSSAVPAAASDAPHDPNDIWVCKECGWTYPNRHPSAKHRRNHKKVCKKTNVSGGGSSSDASSDDEHVGHFGKKKCFPCL